MEKSIVALFKKKVEIYSTLPALHEKNKDNLFKQISYEELFSRVSQFGAGLLDIGVKRYDHIGIISENRKEWIIANLGILGIGAIDVPRGTDSTKNEIAYILEHAECELSLVENGSQLDKILSILDSIPSLKRIIVLDTEYSGESNRINGIEIITFGELLNKGKVRLQNSPDLFDIEIEKTEPGDLATLIYTSGTTGEPKGVMLTHANFLHQIRAPLEYLDIRKGDIFLSVLPIWHAFERTVEYVAIFAGCSIVYSKLIGKVMLADMVAVKPTIFPSVPRIWELVQSSIYKKVRSDGMFPFIIFKFFVWTCYMHSYLYTMARGLLPRFSPRNKIIDFILSLLPLIFLTPFRMLGDLLVFKKIKEKLGGNFRFGISGAGALPPHVDNFFAACGIKLLEGYGLTEAAPICSVRKNKAPVPNTIGSILPEMEAKIIDENGNKRAPGNKGTLFVKGPNVMKGYYKKPEETEKILSPDGWLNTGDLAIMSYDGELKIMGRTKETIVLMGGENVEPGPIEDIILESEFISQVVIVGQDQKSLGALVIPNREALEQFAALRSIDFSNYDSLLEMPVIQDLIRDEINSRINTRKGFKLFEKISKFKIMSKEFVQGEEITHTLKLRRTVIYEKYKKEIDFLFS
jgi:long-chain acyl-CoA synthetase